MRSRLSLGFLLLVLAGLLATPALAEPASPPPQAGGTGSGPAAPEAATPINAACYVAAPGQCKLHVDPFHVVVNPAPNTYLTTVRLTAGVYPAGAQQVIYEYGTDVNNLLPPVEGFYSPSPVAADFPALCGMPYQLELTLQDSQSPDFLIAGRTRPIACPASNVTTQFLPGTFGRAGAAGVPLAGAIAGVAWAWRRRHEA